MSINSSNYELYVLDYLAGNLRAEEVSELLLFMQQHPDIKAEFDLLSEGELVAEEIELDKAALKKPLYHMAKPYLEQLLIDDLEGQLDEAGRYELNRNRQLYPEMKEDEALFAATRILADPAVTFENKAALKKMQVVRRSTLLWRVAASLVAVALLFFLVRILPQPAALPLAIARENPKVDRTEGKISAPAAADAAITPVTRGTVRRRSPVIHKHDAMRVAIHRYEPSLMEPIGREVLSSQTQGSLAWQPSAVPAFISISPQLLQDVRKPFPGVTQLLTEKLEANTAGIMSEENKPDTNGKGAVTNIGLLLVKLYNKATGDDAKIVKKYDSSGAVSGFAIVANNFAFARGK